MQVGKNSNLMFQIFTAVVHVNVIKFTMIGLFTSILLLCFLSKMKCFDSLFGHYEI